MARTRREIIGGGDPARMSGSTGFAADLDRPAGVQAHFAVLADLGAGHPEDPVLRVDENRQPVALEAWHVPPLQKTPQLHLVFGTKRLEAIARPADAHPPGQWCVTRIDQCTERAGLGRRGNQRRLRVFACLEPILRGSEALFAGVPEEQLARFAQTWRIAGASRVEQ
jgi:hypothetical protein